MEAGPDQRRPGRARRCPQAGDLARRVFGIEARRRAKLDRGGVDLVGGGALVGLRPSVRRIVPFR